MINASFFNYFFHSNLKANYLVYVCPSSWFRVLSSPFFFILSSLGQKESSSIFISVFYIYSSFLFSTFCGSRLLFRSFTLICLLMMSVCFVLSHFSLFCYICIEKSLCQQLFFCLVCVLFYIIAANLLVSYG